ncbi:NAD-dependent epimerase/dehydratase family protein [Niveibacterium sp. SC-1]|uniref:NAD-dependent epimerase/dehydratase family protein n=1 Tax=Niveibacterium sp. SC-1 TaxID=3135646 RepID=UPI00311E1637
MRTVVLGAGGFIGSAVSRELQSHGHDVIRVDIAGRGVVLIDREAPDFAHLFADHQPDACINCTGAASVPLSFSDPISDYTLNTVRVMQMLDAIRIAAPEARFVHLSSAAVYGNPTSSPISESSVAQPLSPYGWHKHQAELICREYAQLHGTSTISLRIFSAYGPGLRKQLFWDVMQKARKGTRVELFGTGNETRDFIYVDDLARAINVILEHGHFDGRAINVARGEATTVREAAQCLLDALGWPRDVVFTGSSRTGDPSFWQADVTYLESLGFLPNCSLSDGLASVADWMTALAP